MYLSQTYGSHIISRNVSFYPSIIRVKFTAMYPRFSEGLHSYFAT